jgi:hypothetical protein
MRTALLIAAAALVLAGCSLDTPKPKQIPPAYTPTDSREAARIAREVKVYRRDARLIRNERVTCSKQIAPDLFDKICRPFLTPLAAQQRTHLRVNVGALRTRVGPKCTKALDRVFAVSSRQAGPPLRAAARICRAEYRTDFRRGTPAA